MTSDAGKKVNLTIMRDVDQWMSVHTCPVSRETQVFGPEKFLEP